jgi:hypothetical protein
LLQSAVIGKAVGNVGFKINFPSQEPKQEGNIDANVIFEAGGFPTATNTPPFSEALFVIETA